MNQKIKALQTAFPYTLPICTGFLFLGTSYGFLMSSKGFSIAYPFFMSALIFAGSMEFVTVDLLQSSFQPIGAFLLALLVNARHLFYGISMLEKYRGVGKKRWYLIFGMCDESFSINCSTKIPPGVDAGWFMLFVTLLNHIYWICGATLGALLGNFLQINTQGIEFVMTALFIVIFLNQWHETKEHGPAVIGVAVSVLCLGLLGPEQFMLPAMALIVACFLVGKNRFEDVEA